MAKEKFFTWKNWWKGFLTVLSISFISYISMVLIQNTSGNLSWIVSVLLLIFVPPVYSFITKEIQKLR